MMINKGKYEYNIRRVMKYCIQPDNVYIKGENLEIIR